MNRVSSKNKLKQLLVLNVCDSLGPCHIPNDSASSVMGWQLDAANTGLAGAGIDRNNPVTFPVYTGPTTPPHGTTISLKKITSPLWLINGNITLDRCWIQPTSTLPAGLIITLDYNNPSGNPQQYSNTILDCDIDGTLLDQQTAGSTIGIRGIATVKRCNIYGMSCGINIFDYKGLTAVIENNYIHDLRAWGSGPSGSHCEAGTVRAHVGGCLIWRNNRLESLTGQDTAALFVAADGYINHVHASGNLFHTGNWCFYLSNGSSRYGSDIMLDNNRFVQYGYGPISVASGAGLYSRTENYYYNASIPPDCRGDYIP